MVFGVVEASLSPIFNTGPTVEFPVALKFVAVKFVKDAFTTHILVAAKKGVVTLMSAFKISISPSIELIWLEDITGAFIIDALRVDTLTVEVVVITPLKILMLDPATSEEPPDEDIVVPVIVMFVPAVNLAWTLGAVKLIKLAFVPDRFTISPSSQNRLNVFKPFVPMVSESNV